MRRNKESTLMKDVCMNCRYFHQYGPTGEAEGMIVRCTLGPGGECRRDPPAIPLAHDGGHDRFSVGRWPTTYASGWCGRHQERTPPPSSAGERPMRPDPVPTDIVLRWNSLARPEECLVCEREFIPPIGPCLTFDSTWGFICMDCAEQQAPHAARDCRLLQSARTSGQPWRQAKTAESRRAG
jgi:hypothetical protein